MQYTTQIINSEWCYVCLHVHTIIIPHSYYNNRQCCTCTLYISTAGDFSTSSVIVLLIRSAHLEIQQMFFSSYDSIDWKNVHTMRKRVGNENEKEE